MAYGAEVTRLGAEMPGRQKRGIQVALTWQVGRRHEPRRRGRSHRSWRDLGAMGLGADLGVKIHDAELGFKTHAKVSLAEAPFISSSLFLGFCSPQTLQPLESSNLTLKSWI